MTKDMTSVCCQRVCALAALVFVSSLQVLSGQSAAVGEQRVRAALELLSRVDEATSRQKAAEILDRRTTARERLPLVSCEGTTTARFRLETLELTLMIKSERPAAEAGLLVSEKRLNGTMPATVTADDFAVGGVAGDVADLLATAWRARLEASTNAEYLTQLAENERLRDGCETDAGIQAQHQNEVEATRELINTLTADPERVRALMKRVNLEPIVSAQGALERALAAERAKRSEAAQARARADAMRTRLSTPGLVKARRDLGTAIRRFSAGR